LVCNFYEDLINISIVPNRPSTTRKIDSKIITDLKIKDKSIFSNKPIDTYSNMDLDLKKDILFFPLTTLDEDLGILLKV